MGRTTKYIMLWVGATTLTVTLSWLGVRSVLHTAVFEQPTAVSVNPPARTRFTPEPAAVTPSNTGSTRPWASHSAGSRPTGPAPTPTPAAGSFVRSVNVRGGRAVFSVTPNSVYLMSTVPSPGYRTEVSRNIDWLRVDFIASDRWSSVVASWYRRAPSIEAYER